jgi:DEAD/DEAH box helicase domain-containing protein
MTQSLAGFLDAIAERSAYATIAQAGLDSEPLRRHLRDCLVRPPGTPGSFLADPVVEAGFDWKRADKRMAELTGGLLRPELIEALDQRDPVNPDEQRARYRFGGAPRG